MRTDYELLIAKLDAFIRRYYKDRLIRGGLYAVGLLAGAFLVVALLEHFGRFNSLARTVLFWGFLIAAGTVLVRFVAGPLVKLFRLGPVISHAQAARIIGTHFGEVKDKLLNTLQLREQAGAHPGRRELIEASIAQRSRELGPVPFAQAIDLRRNTRYLRYALPPLLVLAVLLLAAPSLIKEPTRRLMAHGTEFVPEAPFRFLVNDTLEVPEQEDFELEVDLRGQVLPQQVELLVGDRRIPLVRQNAARFTHRFRNVQAPISFQLTAGGFLSEEFVLNTLPNPTLLDFALDLAYPAYLGMAAEQVRNTGDVTVPAGTRITWTVNTRSADRLLLAFDDSTYALDDRGDGRFTAERRLLQARNYRMTPAIGDRRSERSLPYQIDVVPDLYPTIDVEERTDSLAPKRLVFSGRIGDDHGFRRLEFHYRVAAGGDSLAADQREGVMPLGLEPKATRQVFYHDWDLSALDLMPGDRLEHWFEVWDNDGVNGSKSARTSVRVFAAPSLRELAERQEQDADRIKEALQEGIREAQELQRDLDRIRREMLDKKELDWQDKQRLENTLQRQQDLQQRIEQTTEQLRQSQQFQQEFQPMNEELLQKQEQLQELFENVLTEEMKELYRQMEELLEKLDKEALEERMEEMKLSQEDIEKELDRSLELFKQLEVEQQAEDIAEQLEELAEEQKDLSEESDKGEKSAEQLAEEQAELDRKFDEVQEQLDELEKKNSELENPLELPDTEPQEEAIDQQQQQSQEQLKQDEKKKAGESQKKAGEQMEQLAFQMRSSMQNSEQEQQEEDMDALRQLLENIVQLSFDQERVMDDLSATKPKDPRYVEVGRDQKKLRDDARVVEDSLFALSKRIPQLQSVVNREMNAVNENMDQAVVLISDSRGNERQKPVAAERQQRAMTSLNNLALLLDEALQQMMQQMAQQMPGSGSCNKPGGTGSGQGKKPSMAKMKAMQEALNKQLEEMRKGQQKGNKPGEKNEGSQGMPGMSRQLAQMAAQQAAIRKELQRMAQEMNKDGSGSGNPLNKLAQEMEEVEKDIVNRRIDQETQKRQKDILVRLLEAEKAERERELDQQRTSNEGRETPHEDPARYFEYQQRKQRETELLRTVPPGLKPYYRQRVNDYFGTFDRP